MIAAAPTLRQGPAMKAPMLVSAYNWTGFLCRRQRRRAERPDRLDYVAPAFAAADTNPRFAGGLGGIQAGYDHQIGKWVFGVEGDINATNAQGATGLPSRPADSVVTCEDRKDWIGTATARAGYAYGTARYGLRSRRRRLHQQRPSSSICNSGRRSICSVCPATDSQSRVGWTVGFGSEFALAQNWTVRGETNYFDMGTNRSICSGWHLRRRWSRRR